MPNIVARPRKGDRADRPTAWRLTWDLPNIRDGKRRRATETFHGTKTAAEARWRERQTEIERAGGSYVAPSKETLADYLTNWVTTLDLTPSTAQRYQVAIRVRIVPFLGHVPLAELTPARLVAWTAATAKQLTPSNRLPAAATVAQARAVLRSALSDAVRLGLLPGNPLSVPERHKKRHENERQIQYFTLDQARVLDAAMQGHRLSSLFTFLWHSGLRCGEALALRWDDIELETASLWVRRNLVQVAGRMIEGLPKSRASIREIALTESTITLLEQHRDAQVAAGEYDPHGYVFPSEVGTHLFYRNVSRAWHVLRDRAGLPPYRLHALRHTCASLMLQAGIGITEIAAHLGHEDPGFTARIYAHVLEQTKRQAADRFSRLLAETQSGLIGAELVPLGAETPR